MHQLRPREVRQHAQSHTGKLLIHCRMSYIKSQGFIYPLQLLSDFSSFSNGILLTPWANCCMRAQGLERIIVAQLLIKQG